MRYLICATLCCILFFCVFPVQAAEQKLPEVPETSLLKVNPDFLKIPDTKKTAQPVLKPRIGILDINKVSIESNQGKLLQKEIKARQSRLQKQIEAQKKQIEKFKKDAERQLPNLSAMQRESKSIEFQKKIEALQKFASNAEKQLMDYQQKLGQELIKNIGLAANEFVKTKELTAIVVNREMLFISNDAETVDITSDLIKLMDTKNPIKKSN